MYHLFTLYKKDMAEAKLGWVLFSVFGWPITVLGFFGDMPPLNIQEPYHTIMSIFGILFLFIHVLRSREKWRKEKMENDNRSKELREKWLPNKNKTA